MSITREVIQKSIIFLFFIIIILASISSIIAIDVGNGPSICLTCYPMPPKIWLCSNSNDNYETENNNLKWKVLVMDKQGINEIKNVSLYANNENPNKNIVSNCVPDTISNSQGVIDPSCNAKVDMDYLKEFRKEIMGYYICSIDEESYNKMNGKYLISFEATERRYELSRMTIPLEYSNINPKPNLYITFNPTNNEPVVKTDLDYNIKDYSEKCLDKYCNKKIKKYIISNDKQDASLELKYTKSRNNGQIEIVNLTCNGIKQPLKRNSFKIMNSTRGITERLFADKVSVNLDYNIRKNETLVKSYGGRKIITTKENGLSLIQLNIIDGTFNYTIIKNS